jgi:hypothetical protein
LIVHRVSDVRKIEIHTAELLVPDPSPFEVEIAIAKLKRYKLPGSDQIQAELIQAGGETLWSETHKLINSFGIRKNCDKLTSNYHGIWLLSTSYKTVSNILSRLSPYIDEIIGDHQREFIVTGQLLIRSLAFIRYWRK